MSKGNFCAADIFIAACWDASKAGGNLSDVPAAIVKRGGPKLEVTSVQQRYARYKNKNKIEGMPDFPRGSKGPRLDVAALSQLAKAEGALHGSHMPLAEPATV